VFLRRFYVLFFIAHVAGLRAARGTQPGSG
jgi:hypothetical protein